MKKRVIATLLSLSLFAAFVGCEASPPKSLWIDNDKVIKPSEDFIVECLGTIEDIVEIEAVSVEEGAGTEETTSEQDATTENEKNSCYTIVCFAVDSVDQSALAGENLVDKGVTAGGCIEAFETVTDAETRAGELNNSNGEYKIAVGTIVIRISERIDKDGQIDLASKIISALTGETVDTVKEVLAPKPETTIFNEDEQEHLTVENCEDLAALLQVKDPGDPFVATFASDYYGYIVEFDGCVWAVNPTEYKTRFDILVEAGDFDPDHAYGPNFRFTSVGASNLGHGALDIVTDLFSAGDNVHVVAEVRTYDEDSQIFELYPISVIVR